MINDIYYFILLKLIKLSIVLYILCTILHLLYVIYNVFYRCYTTAADDAGF